MEHQLDFLIQIAHGLAVQFGSSCEVVIHDLTKEDIDNSIVHIENGHVSDRSEGDGPSTIVLETLRADPAKMRDRLAYLTKTLDGRILKSSTMYIRNESGNVDYIFSLNYDITNLIAVETTVHSLIDTARAYSEAFKEHTEHTEPMEPQTIPHNVNELLDQLIEQAIDRVGKPVPLMTKDDKIEVVRYLNNAGAFLITKSGDRVSNLLGISKFTLYSYMDKN